MRIHLFVPCFVDQLAPEVAWATVHVLERLGHQVVVPDAPVCCGQPAFNSGFPTEGRRVARAWVRAFAGAECVVAPSGSCVGQIRGHYAHLFEGSPEAADARALAERTHELSELLVDVLRVDDVGARFDGVVCYHDGCHGLRELGVRAQPRRLLARVRGLQLVELERTDLCCGFGGSFAVKLPELSVAMADAKLATVEQAIAAGGARWLVSGETMCLTHLESRFRAASALPGAAALRALHLAQVLASDGTPAPRSPR
jgi:L-lactate dehydrogenase complex protein LldE